MVKSSFSYFLGYNDDDDVNRPFCINPPPIIGYVKYFDSKKTMSFKVNDNRLLKGILKYGEKFAF